MMKFSLIICLSLLVFSCRKKEKTEIKRLPYFNSYELTPQWGESFKTHKIAPFQLTNQNGELISNKTYKGKIYVTNFFFTSCTGICNSLTKNMSLLQSKLENDSLVNFLSHSVTPEIDSITTLKKYVSNKGLKTHNWNLVTGAKETIYTLARESYFADDDFKETEKPSSFIHSENFLLIDPNGYIRGVYNGTLRLEMSRIVKHIAILEKEFY